MCLTTRYFFKKVAKNLREKKMFESSFCKVSYLEKQSAILCKWKKFCKNQDYQNPLEYGLELLNQYSATTWITDTTNGFENDEADSKWLIEEFIPKTIDSTCKNIIFIMRDDSPLKVKKKHYQSFLMLRLQKI